MHEQLLVAILAAGASRRLGRPKQLLQIGGEILIRRQCQIALAAGAGPVAVVLGCAADECREALTGLGLKDVQEYQKPRLNMRAPADKITSPLIECRNEEWQEGIGSSIRRASRLAIHLNAPALLILHVDQYRVSPRDLQAIHEFWSTSHGHTAIRSRAGEYLGPPSILPASLFDACLQLQGDQGAGQLFSALPPEMQTEWPMPSAVFDIDEPSQIPQSCW
jgi:CTP:molybdopterin cytidylyltransferase MocA